MELPHPVGNNRPGSGSGTVMAKVKGAMLAGALAACLPLAALLSACSQSEPPPRDFILVGQPPAKAQEAGNTLEEATRACKEETEKKGIKSITAIFSRLRPGQAEQDYIACMRARGYEVSQ
ncbi:MAG: hypothetical protein WED13_02425 [Methyloceanibacter sp.]